MRTTLLLSFSFCLLSSLTAQTIFVDASNNSGFEDGTEQNPFNTIKEGINAVAVGAQVNIKAGTYTPDDSWSGNDHTLFLKAGVTLIGESRDNTIINGIVVDQESSNLSIGLEKLKFDEFHFIRPTHAGPFNEMNSIRNCATTLISQGFGAGIPVNDTTPGPNYGFFIENNYLGTDGIIEFKQGAGVSSLQVKGNSCGYIYLKSGGGYTYLIDNNDVTYGIFDKSASNTTTISNNRIFNGTISDLSGGNQYGIEDEIIENNTILADENSPAFIDEDYKAGITAKSRSVTIRNNTITCSGHVSGIRSSAGAPLHIIGNAIQVDEVTEPTPDPYEGIIGIFNYSGWGRIAGNEIHGGSHGYYSKAGTVEFANNYIENAFTGFYSLGAEEVHHNTIKNCKSDGMVLDGLRGPIFSNKIIDNGGSGIHVLRVPIDLGGGAQNCPGLNEITGNTNYDLYIETSSIQYPTLFARYNVWDHTDTLEIMEYDIRDGNDSASLVKVDFTPTGHLGFQKPTPVSEFDIFPNPVYSIAIISWKSSECCSAAINILDMTGKMSMTLKIDNHPPGRQEVLFDASQLLPGLYLCQLVSYNKVQVKKILVAGK